jgi:outer membrane protein OmpA-like peptidoglycan-associated protein
MKKNNIFWISYSDLMTSLFFVMLVLFVVTIGYLKSIVDATNEQLEKIQELQTAVQELPTDYFEYQPEYKRFKLKKQIQFDRGKSTIKPEYNEYLINVGKSITSLIDALNSNDEYKKFDIKYLVVIEGMASKDNYQYNYELSYERALALYRLWESKGITFNPETCEIQTSGSGIEGIREYSGQEEYKNQQFLIHIIPKMGKIIEKDEK